MQVSYRTVTSSGLFSARKSRQKRLENNSANEYFYTPTVINKIKKTIKNKKQKNKEQKQKKNNQNLKKKSETLSAKEIITRKITKEIKKKQFKKNKRN